MYFSIPKKPIYANYETLVNCFNCKVIDMSTAPIYEIKLEELKGKAEFEKFISDQNQYTIPKFKHRYDKMMTLREIEEELKEKQI